MAGKKKTPIKERSIYVYLPTKEMTEKWKNIAKKKGMSISNYIQELVQQNIENGETIMTQKQKDKFIDEIQEQNRQLRSENIELSKKVKMLDTLTDRYEEEIKQLKNKPFLNGSFEGIREFDNRLIELLKEKKNVKEHELFDLLHIKPGDSETIKALNRQLDTLFEYNLVKKYKGGIQWLG